MKAYDTWTVLPHSPLRQLEENLWWVEGSLPNMPLKRVTTIVKMGSGDLVVHSALALDDPTRAAVEALGPLRYLVVPSGYHRLDAKAWKARYPEARVLCPVGSRRRVEQVVSVDGSYADLPADPAVRLIPLEGMPDEGVMEVKSKAGTRWCSMTRC